jgi:hypothetical protein
MSALVVLICYLSPQVRKSASVGNFTTEHVTWRVNPQKPFDDPDNFGALSQSLGINTLCEVCDFAEGVVQGVIDTRRTPEELGFRSNMAVYLRQKRGNGKGSPGDGGKRLSADEEGLVSRLRESYSVDRPCPVCQRAGDDNAASRRGESPLASSRKARRRSSLAPGDLSSSLRGASPTDLGLDRGFRLTSEVGVQCGIASRLGDPFMPVSFGSAARLRVDGDPHGKEVNEFPIPSTLGGPSFLKHDGEITEWKSERDRYKGERDQLANLLREEQRKVHELQRERLEHRCDGNQKVQGYLQEIERLQANLRDLMRGRDEVYSLLHQRRTAANLPGMSSDAPRPYAPFRVGAPVNAPLLPHPHELLSKSSGTASRQAFPTSPGSGLEVHTSYVGDKGANLADVSVLKRPSGHFSLLQASSSVQGPQGHLDQPHGQAMLQMVSSVGDPYYVKRRISSELRRDQNFMVLSSLDGMPTDEIEVDDLVQAQVDGEGMLSIATERSQWVLFLNPRERQRWVNWLFVLNPWLSTSNNHSIPNNF